MINLPLMKSYSLEVRDNEYLIRVNKNDIELSFLESLIARIQQTRSYFSLTVELESDSGRHEADRYESSLRFDRLEDK